MSSIRSTILVAACAYISLVTADVDIATPTGYELDGYLGGCGSGAASIVEGEASQTPSCQTCAPSNCFEISVGSQVAGGCIFMFYTEPGCNQNDYVDFSGAGAGVVYNHSTTDVINSVMTMCSLNGS